MTRTITHTHAQIKRNQKYRIHQCKVWFNHQNCYFQNHSKKMEMLIKPIKDEGGKTQMHTVCEEVRRQSFKGTVLGKGKVLLLFEHKTYARLQSSKSTPKGYIKGYILLESTFSRTTVMAKCVLRCCNNVTYVKKLYVLEEDFVKGTPFTNSGQQLFQTTSVTKIEYKQKSS